MTIPHDVLAERASAYLEHGSQVKAATALGIARETLQRSLRQASEAGLLPPASPTMPGFAIKSVAHKTEDGAWVKQVREHGEEYAVPAAHTVKGESALIDADGRVIQKWVKTREDAEAQEAAMRAVVDALSESIPRAAPVAAPQLCNADLLNQYTVTDVHLGMLSWRDETGADYDLKIAERLLLDWFGAAIAMSPNAATAVLAQLGDLLHHDSHQSVTPTSGHVLDADSRLQKIIRVAIRCLRQILRMLLEKHERVHVIMADANHDPTAGAWLREMFAAFYDDEPRVTVDSSASTYYCVEHGQTSLFYHHGHKRKIGDVDSVFAGRFRDVFGRTKHSYAHLGHLHSDEIKPTNLMKVERHETLAAPDAYSANGGWLSGRSAKVITYSKRTGEVGRITLSPEMVAGSLEEKAA